ncbi:MAG: hypothetical protein ABII71_04745 [Candidatus Micrarchaeota archaeon]
MKKKEEMPIIWVIDFGLSIIENWFAFPAVLFIIFMLSVALVSTFFSESFLSIFLSIFGDESGNFSFRTSLGANEIFAIIPIFSFLYSIIGAFGQTLLRLAGIKIIIGRYRVIALYCAAILGLSFYTFLAMGQMDPEMDVFAIGFFLGVTTALTMLFGSLSLYVGSIVDEFREKVLVGQGFGRNP